jgi:hypothetical protein
MWFALLDSMWGADTGNVFKLETEPCIGAALGQVEPVEVRVDTAYVAQQP